MNGNYPYAEVILPVPLADHYTYKVPNQLIGKVLPGCRVTVPFGKRRWYTGIVFSLCETHEGSFKLREIWDLVDSKPVIQEQHFLFWKWIADYYMCPLGDVMKAAVPGSLRPEADTPDKIISVLSGTVENYVRLPAEYMEADREELYGRVGRAPKQKELLQTFYKLWDKLPEDQPGIRQRDLLKVAGSSSVILSGLLKKALLEPFQSSYQVFPEPKPGIASPGILSERQESVRKEIKKFFTNKDVVLLHGVAASGKTEIYIHLIAEQIKKGKQCLYLLPEIALTTQIVTRIRKVFGDSVGIFHSRYSASQRSAVYRALLKNDSRYKVIIGARSAVFLPFQNLGLIIIDEEQDASFKQSDPGPRYHARDAAVILAGLTGAKVLLGTATPAFGTYYNARNNKYGLVELEERYLKYQAPVLHVADVREAYRKKRMHSHFSPALFEGIGKMLSEKKQVILFQNRRGYSPWVQCESCAWIPRCRSCDVSLTWHREGNRLICHYCGYTEASVHKCPECGDTHIKTKGFGTEKIEDELNILFPDARCARMDLDTASTRKKYEDLIDDFDTGKTDILIGTQIVTKGLDFGNVGLVGILNADNMMYFPDFRAFERSYQLLLQVAGRAGRREDPGQVIIQTSDPQHPVIRQLLAGDYLGFYLTQMQERKEFQYPPYARLIKVTMKHRDREHLSETATNLATEMRQQKEWTVLGPQFPVISKIQDRYLMTIILKFSKSGSFSAYRKLLREILDKVQYRNIQINADVDPL